MPVLLRDGENHHAGIARRTYGGLQMSLGRLLVYGIYPLVVIAVCFRLVDTAYAYFTYL